METQGPQQPETKERASGAEEVRGTPVLRGRRRSRAPLFIVLALVVAVAAGFSAGWYFVWSITPPAEVAQVALTAMMKGEFDTLAQRAVRKDREQVLQMKQALAGMPKPTTTNLPQVKIGATDFRDGRATVHAAMPLPADAVQFMGGVKEIEMPVVLAREGREWKVDLEASNQAQMEALRKSPLFKDAMPAAPVGQ